MPRSRAERLAALLTELENAAADAEGADRDTHGRDLDTDSDYLNAQRRIRSARRRIVALLAPEPEPAPSRAERLIVALNHYMRNTADLSTLIEAANAVIDDWQGNIAFQVNALRAQLETAGAREPRSED